MKKKKTRQTVLDRLVLRLRTDIIPTVGMLGLMALAMAMVGK